MARPVKGTDDVQADDRAALASVFARLEQKFLKLDAGGVDRYERQRIEAMATVAGVLIKLLDTGKTAAFEARLARLEQFVRDDP